MRVNPKLAATTALGSVGLVGAVAGFLLGESKLARRAIGVSDERPPSPDGRYGDDHPGDPVRLLVLGDSAAVGYGMRTQMTTPPAMFGYGLAQVIRRPVEVRSVAVVGAESSDLDAQIDRGTSHRADLAVIIIGTNDVTHLVPAVRATADLAAAVRRLRATGAAVVVGTCPDLGTVRPLMQPLRSVARLSSRRMARLQTMATVEAGGRTVSLGSLLGPLFNEHHDLMFGDDKFHPSASGYASMVSALVPPMADALRELHATAAPPSDEHEVAPEMMPMSEAAEHAAQHSGTEVHRAGRWAGVRRRLR